MDIKYLQKEAESTLLGRLDTVHKNNKKRLMMITVMRKWKYNKKLKRTYS